MSPKFAKDQPTGFVNRVEKVAIVGAGGSIGSYFTKSLLATGKHQVTALARAGSSAKLAEGVHRVTIDYNNESTLVEALKGQDFLVITLGIGARLDGNNAEAKLVNAAAKAGVPYVMPNAYGPDPLNANLVGDTFTSTRDVIEELGVSSWIALSTGFWYEWSVACEGYDRFGIDFDTRTVTFFDDGKEIVTTSTWEQCGRALASLLSLKRLPEDENDNGPTVDTWANKVAYISSFNVSQKDMFESAKRVTGTSDKDWTVEYVKSETRYKESVEAMKKGDMAAFVRQLYTRVFFPTGEGDHSKHGLANAVLGLPEENIDEATKESLRLVKTGVLSYATRG
ncbi:NAD(P)-bd-dom domain-containing protein [Mycena indigotica]|uniref:NAD(P)-bd-dom domain-containing protein n=1 Tax=Mycena indigotica TaxID=2126181 RepID=A0A8H6W327_9AGAR|nr:NAD(P)-bd-dom domain-containing protein [Mycena indigotica]KAF7301096.1 NAD(P)-bd-dom domain-containing protein [Mycena indigotica]